MAWPTVVVDTSNMDAAGDNPGNARGAIKQMADNINAIKESKGVPEGIAGLDDAGLIPVENLPKVPATKGGTGQQSYTIGDILVADTASTLTKLPAGAAGRVLKSNGLGQLPSYEEENSGTFATQEEAELGASDSVNMSPLRVKQAILALGYPVTSVNGRTGAVVLSEMGTSSEGINSYIFFPTTIYNSSAPPGYIKNSNYALSGKSGTWKCMTDNILVRSESTGGIVPTSTYFYLTLFIRIA